MDKGYNSYFISYFLMFLLEVFFGVIYKGQEDTISDKIKKIKK